MMMKNTRQSKSIYKPAVERGSDNRDNNAKSLLTMAKCVWKWCLPQGEVCVSKCGDCQVTSAVQTLYKPRHDLSCCALQGKYRCFALACCSIHPHSVTLCVSPELNQLRNGLMTLFWTWTVAAFWWRLCPRMCSVTWECDCESCECWLCCLPEQTEAKF